MSAISKHQWGATPVHILYGNVSKIDDANLFCYPLTHNSELNDKLVRCYLEKFYQEGDLVLCEGTMYIKGVPARLRCLPKDQRHYECISWEPDSRIEYLEKLSDIANQVNAIHQEIVKEELSIPDSKNKLIQLIDYLQMQVYLIKNDVIQRNSLDFFKQIRSYFVGIPNQSEINKASETFFSSIKQCGSENEKLLHKFLSYMDGLDSVPPDLVKNIYSVVGSIMWNLFLEAETEASMEERDRSLATKTKLYSTALKTGQRLHLFGGGFHFRPSWGRTPLCYKVLLSHPRTLIILLEEHHSPRQPFDEGQNIQAIEKCSY